MWFHVFVTKSSYRVFCCIYYVYTINDIISRFQSTKIETEYFYLK